MTNSRFLFLLNLLLIFGCRDDEGVEKRTLVDVTKPSKVSFIGMDGEKVYTKISGKFSGTIKIGMVASGNKRAEGNFKIFKDSVNLDIGMHEIYQDSTRITWYVEPVNTTGGKILISMTEYHR